VKQLHVEVEAEPSESFAELQRTIRILYLVLASLRKSAMLGTVLIIIVILLLIGALPTWGYSSGWGYYPGGGLGIILIIVIILVLMGRI
jgi:Protein of unknown function (DUF3309)